MNTTSSCQQFGGGCCPATLAHVLNNGYYSTTRTIVSTVLTEGRLADVIVVARSPSKLTDPTLSKGVGKSKVSEFLSSMQRNVREPSW